ncbi:MAG: hypothetical protein Q7S79_03180, partial [bacterium]|nr:hypothetical protein [bacterium]
MSEDGADIPNPLQGDVVDMFVAEEEPVRSRGVIKSELDAALESTSSFNAEYDEVGVLIRALPKEESDQIDTLTTKVASGDMGSEEAKDAFKGQAKGELEKALDFATRVDKKRAEVDKLEEEYRPFREEDLVNTVRQLSARVDFDQVMWHLDARSKNDYSSAEMFRKFSRLRITETDINNSKLAEGYHYSDIQYLQETFEAFSKELEAVGLLRSTDHEKAREHTPRIEVGVEVATKRKEVAAETKEVVEQLHEFNRLTRIYRPRETSVNGYTYHVDPGLQQLIELLDLEKNRTIGDERRVEVDYDPRLIEAAKAYVAKKKFGFQIGGRVSQDDETRDIYYSQFHELDPFVALAKVEFKGFEGDTPDGQKRFMTKDAVVGRLAGYIPAGFIGRLLSVEQSANPKKLDDGSQITGEHETVYDENGDVIGSRIYIHRTPFIEAGVGAMEELTEIANYEQTLAHEMGHCVHSWLS